MEAAPRIEVPAPPPPIATRPPRAPTPRQPADAPPARLPAPLELNQLVERWDDIIDRLRGMGRGVLASALGDALPVAVSRTGIVTLQLDGARAGEADVVERALAASDVLLTVVRRDFPGVTRVALRRADQAPTSGVTRRLTEDAVRAEKVASLRKRDPLLGHAIDVLDLELID